MFFSQVHYKRIINKRTSKSIPVDEQKFFNKYIEIAAKKHVTFLPIIKIRGEKTL